MWNFSSCKIPGTVGMKNDYSKPSQASSECSDDEISSNTSREGLECPICWESFNIVENVPYVLWCGHTLCKNCVQGLHCAVVKFPSLPVRLPFFVSCPWCNLLSFRLVYKGNLKFPRKNFFLLWMVESMNGDRTKSHTSHSGDQQPVWSPVRNPVMGNHVSTITHRPAPFNRPLEGTESSHAEGRLVPSHQNRQRFRLSLHKSLVFFFHFVAKFPLMMIFLLIVLYAIPASAIVIVLYILITVLFALPSFMVLYFALPSLDWLVREIFS